MMVWVRECRDRWMVWVRADDDMEGGAELMMVWVRDRWMIWVRADDDMEGGAGTGRWYG